MAAFVDSFRDIHRCSRIAEPEFWVHSSRTVEHFECLVCTVVAVGLLQRGVDMEHPGTVDVEVRA